MDGFDLFRRFMGFPRDHNSSSRDVWHDDEDDEDDFIGFQDEQNEDFPGGFSGFMPPNRGSGHSFQIFTGDPLEMHRDFERQFEDVMRSMMGVFSSFGNHGIPALPNHPFFDDNVTPSNPSIEPPPEESMPRNRYLKPSYEKRSSSSGARADCDLDGRISSSEIDSIFEEKPPHRERRIQSSVSPSFFGQSSVSRTVRGPDGRIEHHKTFKSSDGTEHTTVTRQLGDKSHSITVKKGKDGTTEQEENFVNMDEGELSKFEQMWSTGAAFLINPIFLLYNLHQLKMNQNLGLVNFSNGSSEINKIKNPHGLDYHK